MRAKPQFTFEAVECFNHITITCQEIKGLKLRVSKFEEIEPSVTETLRALNNAPGMETILNFGAHVQIVFTGDVKIIRTEEDEEKSQQAYEAWKAEQDKLQAEIDARNTVTETVP